MPPKIKTSTQSIINAVIEIIEEKGWESVTVREIAKKLNISTQPIYREFQDMQAVKTAAIQRGFGLFTEYISHNKQDHALSQAINYVRFAAGHGNLFNFLFAAKSYTYSDLNDLSHSLIEDTGILEKLAGITGLNREQVYRLHLHIWMELHGLAVISANNHVTFSEEELIVFVTETSKAFTLLSKEGGR